jgi:aerobic-type carbon monoxide dehydrogenase small subunit (CoxS/CutS family)
MNWTVRATVNGRAVAASVPAERLLCDFLREDCGLTGTKEACGVGVCGVCTVLVDGEPVSSCLMLAACADGAEVWTAEGIAERSPVLARSFAAEEGLQCGICTPGQLVSAYALLCRHRRPDPDQMSAWMSGTLCRCTGYASIQRAISAAVEANTAPDAGAAPDTGPTPDGSDPGGRNVAGAPVEDRD